MKSMSRSMMMRKLVGIVVTILVVGGVSTEAAEKQDFEAATQEYEQSSHGEAARVRYATKLADMSDALTPKILHELRKLPMPRDVDSKKLTQLLIGKWESPRHV